MHSISLTIILYLASPKASRRPQNLREAAPSETLPDPVQGDLCIRHKAEKALQPFAGVVVAVGAVDDASGHATGANLALKAVAAMPSVFGQATVTDDGLDGDVGRVVLLSPSRGHLLQRGAVVRLGGDVGRAVGAYQSTVSDDLVDWISSSLQ